MLHEFVRVRQLVGEMDQEAVGDALQSAVRHKRWRLRWPPPQIASEILSSLAVGLGVEHHDPGPQRRAEQFLDVLASPRCSRQTVAPKPSSTSFFM